VSGQRFAADRRLVSLSFRHFFLADIISLKTIDMAVLRLKQPLALRVRLGNGGVYSRSQVCSFEVHIGKGCAKQLEAINVTAPQHLFRGTRSVRGCREICNKMVDQRVKARAK